MANAIEFQKAKQRNYTILLVEDDSHLLKVIYDILKSKGYQVTTATSGEEAVETLNTNDFDLVITDISMGKVNGISVLKKVKELNHETMVIIMTGSLDVNLAIEALRLDADDYILKPFNLADLLERVSNCLTKLENTRKNRRSSKRNKASNDHTINLTGIVSHDVR